MRFQSEYKSITLIRVSVDRMKMEIIAIWFYTVKNRVFSAYVSIGFWIGVDLSFSYMNRLNFQMFFVRTLRTMLNTQGL